MNWVCPFLGRYMSLDLQKLRYYRSGRTAKLVRERPSTLDSRLQYGRRWFFWGGPAGVDGFPSVKRPETQEQKITGQRTSGKNVQRKRILDTNPTTGIRPGRHLLQVQAAEEVHQILVPELETPFTRRRRGQRRHQSSHMSPF